MKKRKKMSTLPKFSKALKLKAVGNPNAGRGTEEGCDAIVDSLIGDWENFQVRVNDELKIGEDRELFKAHFNTVADSLG